MENASKALLMAAGILVGILIIALMLSLFLSSRDLSTSYETRKQTEKVEQFNVNFTKYVGKNLTIHEVVTISNFAKENNVKITSGSKTSEDINEDSNVYHLTINSYSENGYINSIKFSN